MTTRVEHLAVDLVVAVVFPLGLLPVVLVVLHFGALVRVASIVQGVFKTALAALAEAPEAKAHEDEGTSRGRADVDANVGAGAKVVPFLRQGLGGIVEPCHGS